MWLIRRTEQTWGARLKGNAPTSDATSTVWCFPVKARGQEIRERNHEVCSYSR